MSAAKGKRWLQVAKRAAEFRALIGGSEVGEAAQRRAVADGALQASETLGTQADAAWREQASRELFHAGDDEQHRRYRQSIVTQHLLREADAQHARHALDEAQLALRLTLAEKNALQAAIDRGTAAWQLHRVQVEQGEADESWMLGRRETGETS